MAKIRQKSFAKMKSMRLFATLLVPAIALVLVGAASEAWAGGLEFEVTEFKIEFNFTDEDVGVQAFIDGEPWRSVTIVNPKWRTILAVKSMRSLAKQGVTELFLESGEPTLDEVSLQQFLQRFPEGTYRFFGTDVDGKFVRGKAEFTHVIPCGPENLRAITNDSSIELRWDLVEQVVDLDNSTFDNVNCKDPDEIEIVGYRVEAEWEDDDEVVHTFGVDLESDQNSVTLPPEFIPPGQEYKFEVLAIEESGNQTLTELDELIAPGGAEPEED